jgi:hypothetical protein
LPLHSGTPRDRTDSTMDNIGLTSDDSQKESYAPEPCAGVRIAPRAPFANVNAC